MSDLTLDEMDAARAALSLLDPALALAHQATPIIPWRKKPGGFPGLVRLVLEQQVSVASANAIWKRLEAALGTIGAEQILAQEIDQLKLHGLSTQKARYVRAIAEAEIDFALLASLPDEEAAARLRAIVGIGRWTADAYLMICDSRRDVFPAGDIALQEAIRVLDRQAVRPSEKELYLRAERWRPLRSAAAHLLWGYYAGLKNKSISPPAAA